MRIKRWIRMAIGGILLLIIWIVGFGSAVLQLWNHLMPQIFGLQVITFWQAVGLLGLSWLLFGGMRGLNPRKAWGRRRMTPEQRERFRQACRERCGPAKLAAD